MRSYTRTAIIHNILCLIKSQLIRFYHICTNPDDVEEATNTLFVALRHRGYAPRFLRGIKAEVSQQFQDTYAHKKQKSNLQLIPCVDLHHLHSFNSTIRAHFQQAQQNCEPLKHFKVIMTYRTNKNLKDLLVHTAFNKKRAGSNPWLLNHVPLIFNGASGRGHSIGTVSLPQTSNIVYAIECQHCKLLYVGETGKTLKMTIREHINNIKRGHMDTMLYAPFHNYGIQNFNIHWVGS